MDSEILQRWRLILGEKSEETLSQNKSSILTREQQQIDEALGVLYESSTLAAGRKSKKGQGDLGDSAPALAKWLAEIRSLFPEDIVAVIQKDAISRKGLDELLYEPELIKELEPDLSLLAVLLSLKDQVPESSKEAVREIVRKVVEKIKENLEDDIRKAVIGAINRLEESKSPQLKNLNWKKTVEKNLKNWSSELKTVIPEKVYFHSSSHKRNNWTVLINLDQSGSMADSVIYGTVMGSIFASLPALETKVIAFDTSVVDLTEHIGTDPVDMLMGVRLGGGTNINYAVQYTSQYIHTPARTFYILISDLFEGGDEQKMLSKVNDLIESGVRVLVLLSLSDNGTPFYNQSLAKKITEIGATCLACTPNKIPDLIQDLLRGNEIKH